MNDAVEETWHFGVTVRATVTASTRITHDTGRVFGRASSRATLVWGTTTSRTTSCDDVTRPERHDSGTGSA